MPSGHDTSVDELIGLVMGTCQAAEQAGLDDDACQRMVGIVCDGLRVPRTAALSASSERLARPNAALTDSTGPDGAAAHPDAAELEIVFELETSLLSGEVRRSHGRCSRISWTRSSAR